MLKEEFTEWANNGGIRSQDSGYISHAIDVLEQWLDSKMPDADVGNLFRYESLSEFEDKLKQIKGHPDFYEVNRKDQRGRPQAALNKYIEFLKERNYKPIIHEQEEVIRNMNDTEYYKELLLENKNIILHGAPGTGKTYLAKKIAEAMRCTENEIGFVQFHPSYDYTDFVEGLRPVEGTNGVVGFERKDGVFKDFCAKALKNLLDSKKTIETVKAELSNKERIDAFLSKCIADGDSFTTAKGNSFYVSSFDEKHVIISYKNKDESISDRVRIKYSDFLTLIKEERTIERTEVKKLTGRSVERQEDTYSTILINKLFETPQEEFEQEEQSNEEKNYVFIIDEINRGELSKIFGELFFSIDPGYRGLDDNGKPKGLVKTQYQNLVDEDDVFAEGFYIPENVYIIGTMNDIDRSVESMDFAMRRRFIFLEVTAEDSAENMHLSSEAKERMQRINDVIANTEGLNNAYKIGGAYFLNATDFDKLWRIKLSPLINEYLRGIDDDGTKFEKIKDAYMGNINNDSSNEDEPSNY